MYMWNQNNDINEGIYKTETDLQRRKQTQLHRGKIGEG